MCVFKAIFFWEDKIEEYTKNQALRVMAGYLVMCLSVGIGLLIAQLGHGSDSSSSWWQRFVKLLGWILSEKMRLRACLKSF
ncbi:hypothetical protein PN36_34860 [Candidatus Thiomargarita nelsonii]|uniref:Uncharacterized protein n=1 Tax=Candidatus Thiomargarita nelsonii TaxID=1003181 RepID=A0A0A6PN20_9GAMM|nr:hypothetical protein PN36_34860 [Candidatus Thiomargarita nelsonii]